MTGDSFFSPNGAVAISGVVTVVFGAIKWLEGRERARAAEILAANRKSDESQLKLVAQEAKSAHSELMAQLESDRAGAARIEAKAQAAWNAIDAIREKTASFITHQDHEALRIEIKADFVALGSSMKADLQGAVSLLTAQINSIKNGQN